MSKTHGPECICPDEEVERCDFTVCPFCHPADRPGWRTVTRPPEPDRTGALAAQKDRLVTALQRMQQERDFYLTSATHLSSRHGGPMVSCHDEVCRYWSEVFLRLAASDPGNLAATPEPAPVADGTVEGWCDGCGHSWEQHAGALGCTFESDQPDWFCACGEMEPTPTPPTDGAA